MADVQMEDLAPRMNILPAAGGPFAASMPSTPVAPPDIAAGRRAPYNPYNTDDFSSSGPNVPGGGAGTFLAQAAKLGSNPTTSPVGTSGLQPTTSPTPQSSLPTAGMQTPPRSPTSYANTDTFVPDQRTPPAGPGAVGRALSGFPKPQSNLPMGTLGAVAGMGYAQGGRVTKYGSSTHVTCRTKHGG